jgi:hypothetical protein
MIKLFWVMTPCVIVGSYKRYGGTYYLHLQDGNCTALQRRRTSSLSLFPTIVFIATLKPMQLTLHELLIANFTAIYL